jgi:hypothetical protein
MDYDKARSTMDAVLQYWAPIKPSLTLPGEITHPR